MKHSLSQGFRSIFRNSHKLQYAPVLAIAMGLMMARLLVVAHYLNIDDFAKYSFGLLISSSFCMLGCLGLQSLLQRELPKLLAKEDERAGTHLVLQCLVVATLSACVIFLIAQIIYLSKQNAISLLFSAGLLHGLSQQLFLIVTTESRSRGESLRYSHQNLTRAIIVICSVTALAILSDNAFAILISEAGITLVITSCLLWRQLKVAALPLISTLTQAIREFGDINWRSAFLLLMVACVSFAIINLDRWIAADALTLTEFASYSFAWTILIVAQSLQTIINAAAYPALVKHLITYGPKKTYQYTATISSALLIAGIILLVPAWFVIDIAITRWYPQYDNVSTLVLVFLSISVFFISDFWSSYLVIAGYERPLLMTRIISGLTAFAIWMLVPSTDGHLSPLHIGTLALLLASVSYASVIALSLCINRNIFHVK